jgi:hypothetical protein
VEIVKEYTRPEKIKSEIIRKEPDISGIQEVSIKQTKLNQPS